MNALTAVRARANGPGTWESVMGTSGIKGRGGSALPEI
jgi:hypothetical protein